MPVSPVNLNGLTADENNAKIVILSHLGKVKTEEDKLLNTLYPVYLKLQELLDTKIYFSKNTHGVSLEKKVNETINGTIDEQLARLMHENFTENLQQLQADIRNDGLPF